MHIIRPWLFIGSYRETRDLTLLNKYSITAMLQLADAVEQPGITSLYLPIDDGEPIPADRLQKGVVFAIAQKQLGRNVLIACGAGIGRSAAFATAVLKEVEGLSLLEAFSVIKQAYPSTLPHMALWDSLCRYYDEPTPFLAVLGRLPPPN